VDRFLEIQQLKKHIIWWTLSFLVINLACHLSAGTNADSRFATLIAIVEDHSFKIDPYVNLTSDWAKTPEGHYYSNKAPGPMLLAAPIFFVFEKIAMARIPEKAERIQKLIKYKATWLKLLSYLLQVLPFMAITFFAANKLIQKEVSPAALNLFLAAVFFGNTAALLMSTFYGHGITAVFIFALILGIQSSSYGWAGLFFGFAVLCDYSAILLLLPALCLMKRELKIFVRFILGGIVPLVLWVIYHVQCFGSPFNIANKFQNPIYQDVTSASNNLWGILVPYPQLSTIYELLIGPSRGILWVAPWILFLIIWSANKYRLGKSHDVPKELKFAGVSFFLLLWMNSCFGGWHGGLTPGPRYLSPLFPVFAFCLGLSFDRMNLKAQRLVFILVLLALAFSCLVYSTHISPTTVPLWPLYLKANFVSPNLNSLSRLLLIIPLLTFLLIRTLRWPKEN